MVAAAGALVTKMVIAAFAGMGAATICHPLVSILEKMCILRFEELPSLNESSMFRYCWINHRMVFSSDLGCRSCPDAN